MASFNDNHAQALGRVEGKLDTVIARFDRVDQRIDGIEKRVAILEGWRWKLVGAIGVLTFALQYIDIPKILFGVK